MGFAGMGAGWTSPTRAVPVCHPTNGGRVQSSCTLCNGLDLKAPLKNSLGNLWKTCPMLLQWFMNSTACTQVNLAQRCRPGMLELHRISFSLSFHFLYTFLHNFLLAVVHSFRASHGSLYIHSCCSFFRSFPLPLNLH